jgi:glucose-1-phosphate thymidylyltransferase
MKGVILAGGLGTRLYPLTYATNKHLLPIYDKPMIYYPIETLVRAGIKDVIVVTGGPYAGHFLRVLKTGSELGLKHLAYTFQEKEEGIAEALSLCENFADGGPVTVILGDNTTDADISKAINTFESGARIFLKRVPDPKRFGVPVFDSKDKKKIIKIEEKPNKPKSNYAVTGLYIYDNRVFDLIRKCRPSGRGELEITDVNNFYIKEKSMDWAILSGFWSDAGTFDSLFKSSAFWSRKNQLKNKT